MTPRIVWAMQAPTLLNRLASSPLWLCQVADFGDASGLAEASLGILEAWDGTTAGVTHVAVCTPAQWRAARSALPKARLIWVLHCGKDELLPPPILLQQERELPLYLAFSYRVAAMQEAHLGWRTDQTVHVVVPPYVPKPIWRHVPGRAWAMVNRPETRPKNRLTRIERVCQLAQMHLHLFGQNTELGFLSRDERRKWMRSSTAYVSALRHYAGFGLSEHECMAAGVPVIGSLWGDMAVEMPHKYGLSDDIEQLGRWLRNMDADPYLAKAVSMLGLEFISQRRRISFTNRHIERILDAS